LKCAENHSHTKCPLNQKDDPSKYRYANCNGNHAACSKSCEIIIKEVQRKKDLLEKKTKKLTSNFTRVQSANNEHKNNHQFVNYNTNQITNLILFIINILKEFNNIHEAIYEKPEKISKLVSNHFGQDYGTYIQNHLARNAIEEEMDDDSEM
jgi:hypothetical protein